MLIHNTEQKYRKLWYFRLIISNVYHNQPYLLPVTITYHIQNITSYILKYYWQATETAAVELERREWSQNTSHKTGFALW